ncbi:hypothetical protein PMAYCL1PPCAC_25615, partial [Pristionchus mayeri]
LFKIFRSRMADNSKFVLRWVINDATVAHAAERKLESEVFNEGGFKWIASFEKRNDNVFADFFLECGVDHTGQWKCEADVKYSLLYTSGMKTNHEKSFSCSYLCCRSVMSLFHREGSNFLSVQSFISNSTFSVEFDIHIIYADRGERFVELNIFEAPNNRSDIILNIEEKKLHVSKELLALHSPVFTAMFFGDFAEKGKEEVKIKDVVYEEFVDLLHFLYHKSTITDRTVPHILKLADQFQME